MNNLVQLVSSLGIVKKEKKKKGGNIQYIDVFLLVLEDFDFCFAENGLTAYRLGKQLASQSFIQWIGEDEYTKLVNFCLRYIADMELPRKR